MNKFPSISILSLSLVLSCCAVNVFSQNTGIVDSTQTPFTIKIKSQPRFYINLHASGDIALGSTFKFYPDDITSISVKATGSTITQKNVTSKAPTKGLGDGFRLGGGISYIINDFINIGLDFEYFRSTISKIKDSSYTHTDETSGGIDYLYNGQSKITYYESFYTFTPHIIFKAISHPNFYIYNKIGAIIAVKPYNHQKEDQYITTQRPGSGLPDSTHNINKLYTLKLNNPSFGFMGGIGIQVRVHGKILVFGEAQFSHILFEPKSKILLQFTDNGTSRAGTLSQSERITEYENSISSDALNVNPNLPTKAIVQKFPVTYVGFQAGIAYHF
jgi:hypothetical protein